MVIGISVRWKSAAFFFNYTLQCHKISLILDVNLLAVNFLLVYIWEMSTQSVGINGHLNAFFEVHISESSRYSQLAHDAVINDKASSISNPLGLVLSRGLVVLREQYRTELPAQLMSSCTRSFLQLLAAIIYVRAIPA